MLRRAALVDQPPPPSGLQAHRKNQAFYAHNTESPRCFTLTKIALRAESLAAGPCNCTQTPLDGWNSQPISLDERRLEGIGTLVVDDDPEPSYRSTCRQC